MNIQVHGTAHWVMNYFCQGQKGSMNQHLISVWKDDTFLEFKRTSRAYENIESSSAPNNILKVSDVYILIDLKLEQLTNTCQDIPHTSKNSFECFYRH